MCLRISSSLIIIIIVGTARRHPRSVKVFSPIKMFEVVRTAQKQLHSPHSRHPYYIQMMKTSASSTNSISPPPRIPEHITYSYKTVFKVYFNFTFFMCISPFRFSQITSTWDKSVTYRLKKFSPQMVSTCGTRF